MKLNSSFVVVCCLITAIGCSGSGPALKLAPAAGIVRFKDAPVANADVIFHPEDGPVAMGKTDDEGAFQLKTNGQLGATTGKNRVTISAKVENSIPPSDGTAMNFANKTPFPAKYSDPATSDLVIDLSSSGNKELVLDLTE